MNTGLRTILRRLIVWTLAVLIGCSSLAATALAQQTPTAPLARITASLSSAGRSILHGTVHPLAIQRNETGRVSADKRLQGISLVFSRSAAQQADLDQLVKAQQDPASPLYHQWLTPDQFAARFGMAQADLDKACTWLQSQGFTIERVNRSHDRIFFTGTVKQVEAGFNTQMHFYTVGGVQQFAPSTELSVPSALAGVVLNIGNLDSFRPHGMHHTVKPDFTSGLSGSHFLSPGDAATIYDVTPVYQAGFNGNGQSVAIVGQSAVEITDIEHFQTAAGFATPKDPTLVLVPQTGGGNTVYSGDEGESDLDLEWSSTMAPGASIFFVYTGDGGNADVFDSMAYAVDERISPIISVSYGACELAIGSAAGVASIEQFMQQGVTQGQSILVASGDDGASECFRDTNLSNADRAAISVSYPASSTYVTGVGGTQYNEGAGTYWQSNGTNDVISSALSYIPEVVWNEDDPNNGLGASGGGVSTFFSKPSWQVGVPGIPVDGMRDSPDIALDSAAGHDALLFCTSDSAFWQPGQQASCDNGFRDNATGDVTPAGGTSFATPMFAGMLALLSQQQNSIGLGLINTTLYSLASSPGTYASAFHDITGGDNKCDTGNASFCPNGATGYAATTGYDLTTGLGSIDLNNLIAAWGSPSKLGSLTSLQVLTASPSASAPDSIGITVAASSGSSTPTGTVTMTVDGTTDSTPVTLTSGAATYAATVKGNGSHVVVANYSGDATFAASTSTVTFNTLVGTITQINPTSATPIIGLPDTFTFRVSPTQGLNPPTGSVTLLVDNAQVGSPMPLAADGSAATTLTFKAGQHTVVASYSGDSNFAGSSSTMSINATTSSSMTVVAASGTPIVGVADNITVKVAAGSGTTVPSGPLQVTVNGTALATSPSLDATGAATFPVTFTSAGPQSVSVRFEGGTTFAPSTGVAAVIVAPVTTATAVTAFTSTPIRGAEVGFTIKVASSTGSFIPDGTVALTLDGAPYGTGIALTNGAATLTLTFTTTGAHTLTATYSGSSSTGTSTATTTINVPTPGFVLTAADLTVTHGSTGTATLTATPAGGYTGTIAFTVTGAGINNACYTVPNLTVTGSSTATSTLSLATSQPACPAGLQIAQSHPAPTNSPFNLPCLQTEAGFLLFALTGCVRKRSRLRRLLPSILVLSTIGLVLTGCGGSGNNNNGGSTDTKAGTYTLSVTGTDTLTGTIQSQTTVKITVN